MPLDTFVDFLFQNIFFVILFIGGLISLFRRMGTAKDQTEKRRKWQPLPPVAKPFESPLKRRNEAERNETNVDASKSEENKDEINIERTRLSAVQKAPIGDDIVIAPKADYSCSNVQKNHYGVFRKASKRQVAEGIIWAEILGSPRAKRPYSPKNRIG